VDLRAVAPSNFARWLVHIKIAYTGSVPHAASFECSLVNRSVRSNFCRNSTHRFISGSRNVLALSRATSNSFFSNGYENKYLTAPARHCSCPAFASGTRSDKSSHGLAHHSFSLSWLFPAVFLAQGSCLKMAPYPALLCACACTRSAACAQFPVHRRGRQTGFDSSSSTNE
jgi:hypothetical protein